MEKVAAHNRIDDRMNEQMKMLSDKRINTNTVELEKRVEN